MHYRVKTFISLITGFHGIAPVTISRNHHFSFRLSLVGIKQLAPWGSSPFSEIPSRYVTRKKPLKNRYYKATRNILVVQHFFLSALPYSAYLYIYYFSILKALFLSAFEFFGTFYFDLIDFLHISLYLKFLTSPPHKCCKSMLDLNCRIFWKMYLYS